jgi:hypothetical protein
MVILDRQGPMLAVAFTADEFVCIPNPDPGCVWVTQAYRVAEGGDGALLFLRCVPVDDAIGNVLGMTKGRK